MCTAKSMCVGLMHTRMLGLLIIRNGLNTGASMCGSWRLVNLFFSGPRSRSFDSEIWPTIKHPKGSSRGGFLERRRRERAPKKRPRAMETNVRSQARKLAGDKSSNNCELALRSRIALLLRSILFHKWFHPVPKCPTLLSSALLHYYARNPPKLVSSLAMSCHSRVPNQFPNINRAVAFFF